MAKRKEIDWKCEVTFSEGWEKRTTQAFVDLYYYRKKNGFPLLSEINKVEDANNGIS